MNLKIMKDMNRQTSNINLIALMIMVLCLIALIIMKLCCPYTPKEVYYYYDSRAQDTIHKEVITHQILNSVLKRLLAEYNATYKNDPYAEGKGLRISCRMYTDSIYYKIGYASNMNEISGLIICEPVDGKDVSLIMFDLYHYFSLPSERSTEILKNSNPKALSKYNLLII